ncbi:hypothetical protein PENSPDRAFT_656578 [Peniophora sp. CONT]|nr:hypothetical protein PENSPDRAFT_656578 [Peniophora sp. CONT]
MNTTTDVEPFVLHSTTARSNTGKWHHFYTPRQDVGPSSGVAPSESAPVSTSAWDSGYGQGTASEQADPAELPTLIRRLYDLVQSRHEPSFDLASASLQNDPQTMFRHFKYIHYM